MKSLKKINPYDLFLLIFALALVFCISLHLLTPKEHLCELDAIVVMRVEKIKGDLGDMGFSTLADGRFPITVEKYSDGLLTMRCKGKEHLGCFFLEGGKSLTKNQPLSVYGNKFGAEGRIHEIIYL